MLTQNSKKFLLDTLAKLTLLASIVFNIPVFERLSAAFFMVWKFYSYEPSPINLNRSTVTLFLAGMTCFLGFTFILAALSNKVDPKIARQFRVAGIFGIVAVGIVMAMLTTKLAVLTG